jgi:hypothetical protein
LSDNFGQAITSNSPVVALKDWLDVTCTSAEAQDNQIVVIAIRTVTMQLPHSHDLSPVFDRNDLNLLRERLLKILEPYGGMNLLS